MRTLSLILLLTLTACGGGGSDSPSAPVTPPTGDTGGSTGGGTSYPPEGKRLSTKCEGTTVVRELADGKGGSYFERIDNWPNCGYVDLSVELDGTATYFTDVTVTVTGTAEWDYSVSIGNVEETDTGLRIWSDGRVGKGTLTINDQEYYYDVEAEPICQNTDSEYGTKYRLDCQGYYVGGGTRPYQGLIYYGEEDETIVTIETSLAVINKDDPSVSGPIDPSDPVYQEAIDSFRKHSEWFQSQGIWIEFKLIHIEYGEVADHRGVDIMIEAGGEINCGPQPGCIGSTYQGRDFTVGATRPRLAEVINFQGGIVRHEIGHIFGLGHGILADEEWNLFTNHNTRYTVGTFFPTFGHGWYADKGVCANQGTFMTYQSSGVASNELLLCRDLYPNRDPRFWSSAWGDYAGNREMGSDEAYAMNRVRYNVSLIHNEHSAFEAAPLGLIQDVEEDLIVEPMEYWK